MKKGVDGGEWRVVSVRLASFVVLKTFGCRGGVLDPPVRMATGKRDGLPWDFPSVNKTVPYGFNGVVLRSGDHKGLPYGILDSRLNRE